MAQQITKENLAALIELASDNFKFKLPDGFEMIFKMLFERIKGIDRDIIQKKFEQLLLTPNDAWNKQYGFAGYPSLSDWIKIITDEKPKTDEELLEDHKRWEQSINFYIASIKTWLNDRNFNSTFPQYYHYIDPQNQHLAEIINKTYKKVDRTLTKDEILRLFLKLRGEYLEDKDKFTHKLKQSALVIFPEPFKPIIQNQGISLPNFKKIY